MITPPRHRFTRTASVLLAGVSLWLGLLTNSDAQFRKPLSADAQTRLDQQIAALMHDKDARTPAQNKMDSNLVRAAREAQGHLAHPDAPKVRSGVAVQADHTVELDLTGTITDKLLDAIKAAGGRIVNSFPEYHAARIFLPVDKIEAIAGRDDVKFIRPAVRGEHNTGSVDSQGDQTHQAVNVRNSYGVTGAGVTVGVISNSDNDSHNSASAAFNSGDLDPNNTFVLKGQDGSSTEDGEGLAMEEVVHDIAPGAKIIYATADGGPAQTATNINNLVGNGCNVIVDDITFGNESPFQDSVVSQAVNAASAKGVLYFSSARNSGNFDQGTASVWEGNFKDGGDASGFDGHTGSRYHLFTDANGNTSLSNQIVDNGQAGSITLFWSDPLGGSDNDYDVYEINGSGDVVAVSDNRQTGSQDPIEDTGTAIMPGDYVGIIKYSGASRFLHVEVGRLQLEVGTRGCVRGHNAAVAANAFSVAATPADTAFGEGQPTGPYPNVFSSSNETETFSSDGPRRMFYEADGTPYTAGNFLSTGGKVFAKPDLTAADGVDTTVPAVGGDSPFFGTSCAAPHAASLAALVLSKYPSLTPAQVGKAMRAGVVVPEASLGETSNTYGAGILVAPKIFTAAASLMPPTITSFSPTRGPVGTSVTINGTGFSAPLSVTFTGGVAASGSFSSTQITVTVPSGAETGKITVTTSNGSVSTATSFTVGSAVAEPVISSAATATATVGVAFTYQITASNDPTKYGVGGLFGGLKVDSTTGKITGTLTGGVGTHTLTLQAANAGGTGTKTLTLTVKVAPPTITSASTATATVGKAFSYQITATGSPTRYGVGGLFGGLKVDSTTGKITGTLTGSTGTHPLTLQAANAGGTGTKTLTLTVN